MSSIEEIREVRLKKLEKLKSLGLDPYPASVPRDFSIKDLKDRFGGYKDAGKDISVAGRVMTIRGQGAILFVVLFDGTERIQAIIKKDLLGEEVFMLFTEVVDIGDFISVTGKVGESQSGEQSVFAEKWTMATKSLLPLPEKWHGLTDTEERYRKRYLDLLNNQELRDLLVKKAKFW
ncbi:MAG TPA: OB-fold nucleic acid binding domain-containing protein, partial [Candidatus Paceibacterota bacterium]